ncbi:MAG: endolytic transglycosylase MltG [Actinomycetales bacterium]|nr:endolytic transglycosylase MltG [Actinomycetales bacterium]
MSQLGPMMTSGPLPPSRHRATWGKRIAALIAVGIALAMVGASILLIRGPEQAGDVAGVGTGDAVVVVSTGDTLTEIGQKLAAAGVVASVDDWINTASVDERAAKIGPGKYALRKQMSATEALNLMLDPASRADSRLVLPEGLRLEQTVATAAEATSLPKSDFQKVLRNPTDIGLPAWAKDRPEGFLFPATYDLTGEETAKGLIKSLVARFNQASQDVGLEERAKEAGITPYEALIVASLVEAEVAPGDFAKAARVIYNRLDKGMPLQLDSTVAFALGIKDLQLNQQQLATDSPYNTYVRKGLPPRPINSPGQAAIEAALSPAKGKWLYFVAVDPQSKETKFARTYDQFLALKREFQANLAQYEKEQAQSSSSSSGNGG